MNVIVRDRAAVIKVMTPIFERIVKSIGPREIVLQEDLILPGDIVLSCGTVVTFLRKTKGSYSAYDFMAVTPAVEGRVVIYSSSYQGVSRTIRVEGAPRPAAGRHLVLGRENPDFYVRGS